MPFVVLWSHILGGYIGVGGARVGLGWGSGTCGVIHLHIRTCICPIFWPCGPISVLFHYRYSLSNPVLFHIILGVHLLGALHPLFSII